MLLDAQRQQLYYQNADSAEVLFKLLLQMKTSDSIRANVYFGLGEIKSKEGFYEEAIKDFRKALLYDSFHVFTLNQLGIAYALNDRYDSARYFFKKALPIDSIGLAMPNLKSLDSITGDIKRR